MRKIFMTLFMFAAIAAATFTSCSNDEGGNGTTNGGGLENTTLKGTITGETTLEAKEYTLEGTLIVADGGVLTIPAGTTIKATNGNAFSKYILVAQGGKIYAKGTAEKPVIFTSETQTPGAWGGLIINGKAPISGATTGETGATEINNDYKYGGTITGDNSGELTYIKLLYTGANNGDEIEHNGLTLNGVGNGTKVENIYVINGADDAIEFFGGSVNVTNLLAVNPDDDMFDFTQGYTGTLKNCYGIWEASYKTSEEDPRGVEADGNLDGKGPDHKGQSDFRIENMTVDNRCTSVFSNNGAEERTYMHDVIKIRRGAKATIVNALVKGNGIAQDLIDLTDGKGNAANGTSISITNQLTEPLKGKEQNPGDVDATINITTGNTGADKSLFTWTGYTGL